MAQYGLPDHCGCGVGFIVWFCRMRGSVHQNKWLAKCGLQGRLGNCWYFQRLDQHPEVVEARRREQADNGEHVDPPLAPAREPPAVQPRDLLPCQGAHDDGCENDANLHRKCWRWLCSQCCIDQGGCRGRTSHWAPGWTKIQEQPVQRLQARPRRGGHRDRPIEVLDSDDEDFEILPRAREESPELEPAPRRHLIQKAARPETPDWQWEPADHSFETLINAARLYDSTPGMAEYLIGEFFRDVPIDHFKRHQKKRFQEDMRKLQRGRPVWPRYEHRSDRTAWNDFGQEKGYDTEGNWYKVDHERV